MSQHFVPPWWCRNRHCQTLLPKLLHRRSSITLRRQRLELPDGDFLDLDWTPGTHGPIVLILHGLQGSSDSHYAQRLLEAIHQQHWRGVVMHFRGCSGEPNRLPRSYHSGDTGDIDHVIGLLRQQGVPLATVGFSLGGNALLKWLGTCEQAKDIQAAVSVCVPLVLGESVDYLHQELSYGYERYLLRSLKASILHKARLMPLPIDTSGISNMTSIRVYDDKVTAPLHGFQGAEDYYTQSSARQYLPRITTDTLLLQALDDPFMPTSVLPTAEELPPAVTLEVQTHGGHVGFINGGWPWRPKYWLEPRIIDFLQPYLNSQQAETL